MHTSLWTGHAIAGPGNKKGAAYEQSAHIRHNLFL